MIIKTDSLLTRWGNLFSRDDKKEPGPIKKGKDK